MIDVGVKGPLRQKGTSSVVGVLATTVIGRTVEVVVVVIGRWTFIEVSLVIFEMVIVWHLDEIVITVSIITMIGRKRKSFVAIVCHGS